MSVSSARVSVVVPTLERTTELTRLMESLLVQEFKEFEVIEVCANAGFVNDNIKKILNEKLSRRNLAAHPSLVEIIQYQAEDMISDVINNVILKLT